MRGRVVGFKHFIMTLGNHFARFSDYSAERSTVIGQRSYPRFLVCHSNKLNHALNLPSMITVKQLGTMPAISSIRREQAGSLLYLCVLLLLMLRI
jgi:hypothetical protein